VRSLRRVPPAEAGGEMPEEVMENRAKPAAEEDFEGHLGGDLFEDNDDEETPAPLPAQPA
ncbi:Cpsf3l, partial [Symbiodinium necroappetens]